MVSFCFASQFLQMYIHNHCVTPITSGPRLCTNELTQYDTRPIYGSLNDFNHRGPFKVSNLDELLKHKVT